MRHVDDESYKVILLGNSGTGKTTLLSTQINGPTEEQHLPTIGCNSYELKVNNGKKDIRLKVWDTAGQEVYRSVVPIYIRGASAAILVFDVTEESSFSNLDSWVSLVSESETEAVPFFVVGNKIDLENCKVDKEQAKNFANSINGELMFVSAISGENVDALFKRVACVVSDSNQFITQVNQKKNDSSCC